MNENMENQLDNPDQQNSPRTRKTGGSKETIFIVVGAFLLAVLTLGVYLIYLGKESAAAKLGFVEQRMTALEQRLALLEKQQVKLREEPVKAPPEKVETLEKVPAEKEKPPGAASLTPPSEKKRYHEVQKGETLFRISRKYGISVDDLRRVNNLSPEATLLRGQKLLISKPAKG